MSRNFEIKATMPYQFVEMHTETAYTDMAKTCTANYLQKALSVFEGVEVVSVTLNESGSYKEEGSFFGMFDHTAEEGLPAYYQVDLKKRLRNGKIACMTGYLPVVWNERFFGAAGGGSASFVNYQQHLYALTTPWTLAVRNHFAVIQTDCAIGFTDVTWGFKEGTTQLDLEHLREWAYDAAHDVAVIGKKLTEVVYGKAPEYSYIMGISAGGRTTLGEAQRFPEDYDGYWANCPAVPWVGHLLNQTWPFFVMTNEKYVIPQARAEAFYQGLLKKYGCAEDGYLSACYFPEFDPFSMVGEETPAGKITEKDAEVAKKIYDGPRFRDGRRMDYCDNMGVNIRFWQLILYSEDGTQLIGSLSGTALQAFQWALERPELKLEDITYEDVEQIYEAGTGSLRDLDNMDPNLVALRDAGKKLLITHASSDYCCPLATTLKYYNQVVRFSADSEEEASHFIRCFVSMGGGHGDVKGPGELMAYPDTFAALMKWVEDGEEPAQLPAQKWDAEKGTLIYSGRMESAYSVNHKENKKIVM